MASKRKAFCIEDKVNIIREIQNGGSQADICRKKDLSKSTVGTIWKNRESILSAFDKNLNSNKKLRKAEHQEVEEAVLKWFSIQRSRNVPISGQMIQSKADEFATKFGITFSCSSGWLDRFKKRNNISSGKIVGESASVSSSDIDTWKENVWNDISGEYDENDIFNADEAALFYKMTPNQTLKFNGEKCNGGKLSKDRITFLACANMSGTERRKLLVIGKSRNPRCFKNIKRLPVSYEANLKAWMTKELFGKELRKWDRELSSQKRKILLLLDNCSAHKLDIQFQSIRIVLFPPNATSVIQPMDQGVIRSLKCHYRKQLILRILEGYDENAKCNVSLLDALIMLEKAWQCVTESTIRKCFRHAGLVKNVEDTKNVEDLSIAMWIQNHKISTFSDCDMQSFETCDDEIITCDDPTDEEIVEEIRMSNFEIEDSASHSDEENHIDEIPTIADATAAMRVINKFLSTQTIEERVLKSFDVVDTEINKMFLKSVSRQQKITDYFCIKTVINN